MQLTSHSQNCLSALTLESLPACMGLLFCLHLSGPAISKHHRLLLSSPGDVQVASNLQHFWRVRLRCQQWCPAQNVSWCRSPDRKHKSGQGCWKACSRGPSVWRQKAEGLRCWLLRATKAVEEKGRDRKVPDVKTNVFCYTINILILMTLNI